MWAESDGNFSPWRKHARQNGHLALALRPATESGPSAAARTSNVGGGDKQSGFLCEISQFLNTIQWWAGSQRGTTILLFL